MLRKLSVTKLLIAMIVIGSAISWAGWHRAKIVSASTSDDTAAELSLLIHASPRDGGQAELSRSRSYLRHVLGMNLRPATDDKLFLNGLSSLAAQYKSQLLAAPIARRPAILEQFMDALQTQSKVAPGQLNIAIEAIKTHQKRSTQ